MWDTRTVRPNCRSVANSPRSSAMPSRPTSPQRTAEPVEHRPPVSRPTCRAYSMACLRLNLLPPFSRSTNWIGISRTRSWSPPSASNSSPILKPLTCEPWAARRSRRTAKKPDIGSETSVTRPASAAPAFETNRRCHGQPGLPPPGTYRLPTVMSQCPSRTGLSRAPRRSGGWLRSASMTTTTCPWAARAAWMTSPASPALPSDRTSRSPGTSPAIDSTTSPVPSVDPPSAMRISPSMPASLSAATIRGTSSGMFSASLRVGTMTLACRSDNCIP